MTSSGFKSSSGNPSSWKAKTEVKYKGMVGVFGKIGNLNILRIL